MESALKKEFSVTSVRPTQSAHHTEIERNTLASNTISITMDFLNEMNAPPVVRTNSDQRNGGDCGDGAEMNAPPVTRTNSDQRNGGDCGDD